MIAKLPVSYGTDEKTEEQMRAPLPVFFFQAKSNRFGALIVRTGVLYGTTILGGTSKIAGSTPPQRRPGPAKLSTHKTSARDRL